MRFQGKVLVVAGTGPGIGRATAELLAAEGASVIVNGRTKHEVETVAAKIRGRGAKAASVVADVGEPEAAERPIGAAEAEFGRIDVLVNNAAVFRSHDFIKDSFDDWMKVLEVNLLGAVRCARAVASRMVQGGQGGRI